MADFKPAWWQLKKPIIDYRTGIITALICIFVLFVCGYFLVTNAIVKNEYPNAKVSDMSWCWPIIYLASAILGLDIILSIFNVIG